MIEFIIFVLIFYLCIMLASGFGTIVYRYFDKDFPKSLTKCYCDKCKHVLTFWEANLPIFNFIMLKGKCSYCNEIINPLHLICEVQLGAVIYLLIELLIGVLYVF